MTIRSVRRWGAAAVSLETAVKFTRFSVYLAYCWPPPPDSTKRQNTKFDILWSLSLASSLALLLPLLASIHEFQGDVLVATKSTIFTIAVANFATKMIVCRVHRRRMQVLIYEMVDFLKGASAEERAMLESYANRCFYLHATLTCVYYLTAAAVICGPMMVAQQQLPTDAVYPFPLTRPIVGYTIYAHQAFVGLQCSTGLSVDFQPALLMWFAGARLELLAREAEALASGRQLNEFVTKHQHLLRYADEVKRVVRYVTLTTAAMTGIATAFGLLQIISPQPFVVKLQFASVVLSSGMNLYTCAWSADNLTKVCYSIGNGIYNSAWPNMPAKFIGSYVVTILQRCQKPVVISINGFIPILSLHYYGSFLSKAFSYFTTLRISVDLENSNA